VMVTLLAIGALTGGVAYAANTVFSTDIVNGEVKSVDIGTGQVQSVDVTNEGLTGADIANNSLKGADIAEPSLHNVDAGAVGGLQVRKINFQVPAGTGATTVLDLAGLQITAECQNFGDELDVKAFTAKNGASVFYFAGSTFTADDTDAFQDINSNEVSNGNFNIGDQLQIDDATPNSGGDAIGTLNYSAPDGSVVVARLAFDEMFTNGVVTSCALTGTATGG
jgi:hypothetical protein